LEEIASLKEAQDTVVAELKEKKVEVRNRDCHVEDLHKQVGLLEEKRDVLDERINEALSDLSQKKTNEVELKKEIGVCRGVIEEQTSMHKNALDILKRTQEELLSERGELKHAQKELKCMQDELKQSQEEIVGHRNALQDSQDKLSVEGEKSLSFMNELSSRHKKHTEEVSKYEEELLKLKKKQEKDLNKTQLTLIEDLDLMRMKCKQAADDNSRLSLQLEGAREALQSEMSAHERSEEVARAIERRLVALQLQYTQLEALLASERTDAREEKSKACERSKSLELHLEALRLQHSIMEGELNQLREQALIQNRMLERDGMKPDDASVKEAWVEEVESRNRVLQSALQMLAVENETGIRDMVLENTSLRGLIEHHKLICPLEGTDLHLHFLPDVREVTPQQKNPPQQATVHHQAIPVPEPAVIQGSRVKELDAVAKETNPSSPASSPASFYAPKPPLDDLNTVHVPVIKNVATPVPEGKMPVKMLAPLQSPVAVLSPVLSPEENIMSGSHMRSVVGNSDPCLTLQAPMNVIEEIACLTERSALSDQEMASEPSMESIQSFYSLDSTPSESVSAQIETRTQAVSQGSRGKPVSQALDGAGPVPSIEHVATPAGKNGTERSHLIKDRNAVKSAKLDGSKDTVSINVSIKADSSSSAEPVSFSSTSIDMNMEPVVGVTSLDLEVPPVAKSASVSSMDEKEDFPIHVLAEIGHEIMPVTQNTDESITTPAHIKTSVAPLHVRKPSTVAPPGMQVSGALDKSQVRSPAEVDLVEKEIGSEKPRDGEIPPYAGIRGNTSAADGDHGGLSPGQL